MWWPLNQQRVLMKRVRLKPKYEEKVAEWESKCGGKPRRKLSCIVSTLIPIVVTIDITYQTSKKL